MAEEAAREYQKSIEDLTFNSKLHINVLTMIAGENNENGYTPETVKVIENRLQKAPVNQKLPVLYLMDSIMKNLRQSSYATLFSPNIVENFALVFEEVDEKKRQSMYKLRITWNELFPNSTLYALDCKINQLDPAWPITAQKQRAPIIPTDPIESQITIPGITDKNTGEPSFHSPNSIHVNPKFLKNKNDDVRRKREDEMFRAELLKKQRELEAKKRLEQEAKERKKWEEEQEKKMKEEYMAKQQELMRLQQQKLELELEETRRSLRMRELELKRKEEVERQRERDLEREREYAKQIEDARRSDGKKPAPAAVKGIEQKDKLRESGKNNKVAQADAAKKAVVAQPRSRDPRLAKEEPRSSKDSERGSVMTPSKQDKDTEGSGRVTPSKQQKPSARVDSPVPSRSSSHTKGSNDKRDRSHRVDKNRNDKQKSDRGKNDRDKVDKAKSVVEKSSKVSERGETERRDTEEKDRREKVEKSGRERSESKAPDSVAPGSGKSPVETQETSRRKSAIRDRRYRRSRHSVSSGSESEQAPQIRPSSSASRRSNDRRKRKLSPSGTEVVRHKRQNSKSRDHHHKRSGSGKSDGVNRSAAEKMDVDERHAASHEAAAKEDSSQERKKDNTGGLLDLFGKEDVDYRHLPTIPKKQPPPADACKSPSVSWSKFKQDRPETFTFQQPRRMSFDTEMRSPLSALPAPPTPPGGDKDAALGSASITNAEDILKFAEHQRARGVLSDQQYRDLMDQLTELVRLQRLREEARARRASTEQLSPLAPPPKPPMLGAPRKTLLPDPVAFNPGSPSRQRDPEPPVKQPLLPPPLPPRTLLEAPRFPAREPLLPAPRPPLLLDGPEPTRFGPMRRPRFDRVPRGGRGRPMFPSRSVRGDGPDRFGPRPPFMGLEPGHMGGPHGPEPLLATPPSLLEHSAPGWIDINLPYVPEEDARWYRRVHFARDASFLLTKYEVVINGNPYDLSINRRRHTQRKIQFGDSTRSVRLDHDSHQLFIDDVVQYRVHEHECTVMLGGTEYRIYVRGPTEKMWIDGHQFEVRLDAPPERVIIANAPYDLYIDRTNKEVVVDGRAVCAYSKDAPHDVVLGAGKRHVFQFFPPARQILIDGEECVLDMSRRFPAVRIKGRWHGVRFDGPPRHVIVNDKPYTVPVDTPLKVKVEGRPYLLALGGPGHEVIIEDEWYEVKFGGTPVFAKIGNFKTFKLQLDGGPPEVRILGVIESFGDDTAAMTTDSYEQRPVVIPSPPLPPSQGLPEVAAPPANVNVNDLFSKLLSSGIIQKVSPPAAAAASEATPAAASPNQVLPGSDAPQSAARVPSPPTPPPAPIVIQPVKTDSDATKPESMQVDAAVAEGPDKVKAEYYASVPFLGDLDPLKMKVKYAGVIACMYSGMQCTSCAARFRREQQAEYKEHLDWHFRQNKRETQDSKVVRNRRWYYEVNDWVQYEEIADVEERVVSNYFENMIQSIQSAIGPSSAGGGAASTSAGQKPQDTPIASSNDEENMCEICMEPFEQFYDDDEEEWHLRDAIRVDNRVYHPVCYDDYKEMDHADDEAEVDGASNEADEKMDDDADVTPQATAPATAVTSSPPCGTSTTVSTSSTDAVVKSEPKVEQKPAVSSNSIVQKLSTPILDMVSNPLAYLEALSQKARLANAATVAAAASEVKTEATSAEADVSSSDTRVTAVASQDQEQTDAKTNADDQVAAAADAKS